MHTDKGLCTFNFVFAGGDGRTYAGTAGHCVLGEGSGARDAGEESWPPGTGPAARDGDGRRVGEFAYAVVENPKDFALVRLDEDVPADPEMCHFGGPTGINADQPATTVVLQYVGSGTPFADVLPARQGLALGMPDPDHVFAQGLAAPGDSGAAVTSSDGRAVGVLVTFGVHASTGGFPAVDAGVLGITRLQPQLDRAAEVLGMPLTLSTAPARAAPGPPDLGVLETPARPPRPATAVA